MWIGVVNVIVDPETDAISLPSAVGLSGREYQDPAVWGVVENASAAKSSTSRSAGLCFCHTTRKSEEAQIWPRPSGPVRQPAPEASSSKTIWPGENPAALATVTAYDPLTASAVSLAELTAPAGSLVVLLYTAGPTKISGDGSMFTPGWGNGLAPLVFASLVWPGPAPRKVIHLLISRKLPLLTMKVPASRAAIGDGRDPGRII